MFGRDDEIKEAAAEFTGTFGLRSFPGQTGFYVSLRDSYVSDEGIQLYVFDEHSRAFAKTAPDELRREIVGRIG